MSTETVPAVYAAINAVMADMAKEGISKDRKNEQQGYKFRGIDDVYNALSPILARHGLLVLPRVLKREVNERQTAKGGILFYVTVEVEYDLVAAKDGSRHVIKTFGEAMDSGDKATNKAMSAAFKYAAMQAFSIPTEGDNDADGTTHGDIAPKQQSDALRLALHQVKSKKTDAALGEWWNAQKADMRELMDDADYGALVTAVKAHKAALAEAMAKFDEAA